MGRNKQKKKANKYKGKKKNRGKKKHEFQENNEWSIHFAAFQKELNDKGLFLRDISGDGNCLFRAIADQVDGDQSLHIIFRQMAVEYMAKNPMQFSAFIDDSFTYEDYLKDMSKPGEWGGNLELQALSKGMGLNIAVYMLGVPPFIILNNTKKDSRLLHVAYHVGNNFGEHYSSVRKLGDDTKEPPIPIEFNMEEARFFDMKENDDLEEEYIELLEEVLKNSTNHGELEDFLKKQIKEFDELQDEDEKEGNPEKEEKKIISKEILAKLEEMKKNEKASPEEEKKGPKEEEKKIKLTEKEKEELKEVAKLALQLDKEEKKKKMEEVLKIVQELDEKEKKEKIENLLRTKKSRKTLLRGKKKY